MLEGKLVRLRPMEPEDRDRFYQWMNDDEVKEFLGARYYISRLAEGEWLAARTKEPVSYANLHFAVETLDGRHIGSMGFHETVPEDRKATLGILIGDKEFWDRGYGTDAMRTLLRFAFQEMNLNRVMLHVDERNHRAQACYRKCGFVEEGRLRQDRYGHGRYWDTLVMGILRDEFAAAGAGQ
jgi:RimJ/RimL family protein N-acetyltransferase